MPERLALGLGDLVLPLAVARPLPRLLLADPPGDHLHGVRHHEGGVEAHAELADEARALLRVRCHGLEELARARARDGAEVLLQVLLVHPDARVGDGQGLAVLRVEGDVDARDEGHALVLLLGEGEVLQLVQRVRGVGDELAEEDLRVRVQRMDDEREELVDFRLELVLCHGLELSVTFLRDCGKSSRVKVTIDRGRAGVNAGAYPDPSGCGRERCRVRSFAAQAREGRA